MLRQEALHGICFALDNERREAPKMRRTVLSLIVTSLVLPGFAATFQPEVERKSGDWAAVLYRNDNGNRPFCALESYGDDTVFRVVRYKDSGDTFLEIHNPDWRLIEGKAKFDISITIGNDAYRAEMMGQRYADAYVYDFTERETYLTLLGMIAQADSIRVTNSNGADVISLSGRGSKQALTEFGNCLNNDWLDANQKTRQHGSEESKSETADGHSNGTAESQPSGSCPDGSSIQMLTGGDTVDARLSCQWTDDDVRASCAVLMQCTNCDDVPASEEACLSEFVRDGTQWRADCSVRRVTSEHEKNSLRCELGEDGNCLWSSEAGGELLATSRAHGTLPYMAALELMCPRFRTRMGIRGSFQIPTSLAGDESPVIPCLAANRGGQCHGRRVRRVV